MSDNLIELDLKYAWIWFCPRGIDESELSTSLEKFKSRFGVLPDAIFVKNIPENIQEFSGIPLLQSNYALNKTLIFGVLNDKFSPQI